MMQEWYKQESKAKGDAVLLFHSPLGKVWSGKSGSAQAWESFPRLRELAAIWGALGGREGT